MNGSCNEQEFYELWQILSENPDLINHGIEPAIQAHIEKDLSEMPNKNTVIEGIVRLNRERIEKSLTKACKKQNTRRLYSLKIVSAVAAACVIFFLMYYMFIPQTQYDQMLGTNPPITYNPATQQATLTLNDGRYIHLDSDTIPQISLKEDKLLVNGEEALQGNLTNKEVAISTPRGAYFIVNLPDGSKVHLHASSKISFSSSFQSNRAVQLSGEAYFDVVHDPSRKFTVKTEKQSVEVLGTRFNIGAYQNEPTQTTLVEGSVKISGANNKTIILKPGQQAINDDEILTMKNVDSEDYISWTKGELRFVKEPLNILLGKISRWYDIDVQMDENLVKSITFSGQLFQDTPLKDFLSSIQESSHVSFELNNKKLIVKSKP